MSGVSVSVRTQRKWACYWFVMPYIYTYSDKHTSAREEKKISPPNLSEGGSLCSPIKTLDIFLQHFAPLDGMDHWFPDFTTGT